MDWGWGLGKRVLVNQLTLPQQSKKHYMRRRHGHSERCSHHPPFISTRASPAPLATLRLWVQQAGETCIRHMAPKQLCQVQQWRADTEPDQKLIGSRGSGSCTRCLGPFGDPELQQLTSLDTKQPPQCARHTLLPRARWPRLVHCLLPKHPRWKGIHVTPGEELWALSITLTKHVGLSPSVIWFGCVVLSFLHQTFDKV